MESTSMCKKSTNIQNTGKPKHFKAQIMGKVQTTPNSVTISKYLQKSGHAQMHSLWITDESMKR